MFELDTIGITTKAEEMFKIDSRAKKIKQSKKKKKAIFEVLTSNLKSNIVTKQFNLSGYT